MPSLVLTKLSPVDPDTIACTMLAMQSRAEGGVASKLLNLGSDWILLTSCMPRFVSAKLCLL